MSQVNTDLAHEPKVLATWRTASGSGRPTDKTGSGSVQVLETSDSMMSARAQQRTACVMCVLQVGSTSVAGS